MLFQVFLSNRKADPDPPQLFSSKFGALQGKLYVLEKSSQTYLVAGVIEYLKRMNHLFLMGILFTVREIQNVTCLPVLFVSTNVFWGKEILISLIKLDNKGG